LAPGAWLKDASDGKAWGMNALTLLKQDHDDVEALFTRFEQAAPRAYREKREIADRVIEELSTHASIEEQVFYPAIRKELPDEAALVLEALEEHHLVKLSLAEIEKLPAQAERFTAKMTVLMESVRHHVQEEEAELFPKVSDAFSVQELEEMGEAMERAKDAVPTRPHPFQPDTPPLNQLLGLPAAILDRMVTAGREAVGRVLNRRC
jgi:hemerythrin superfamily protein